MGDWERGLATVSSAARTGAEWILVGSAATRPHEVDLEPGDVDVLVHPATTDQAMAELGRRLIEHTAADTPSQDLETFLSTPGQPLVQSDDGSWLFGRWIIDGCKVEVARIRVDLDPGLIVETMGEAIWEHRQTLVWRSERIPVVPLEVQLATCMARNLTERSAAIRDRLVARGCDQRLLSRVMAARWDDLTGSILARLH